MICVACGANRGRVERVGSCALTAPAVPTPVPAGAVTDARVALDRLVVRR